MNISSRAGQMAAPLLLSLVVWLVAGFASSAAVALPMPITYSLDRTISASSAVGTITTDGTLGALAASNILAWDITLTTPSSVSTLTDGNSTLDVFSDPLTATGTALMFDFLGSNAFGSLAFSSATAGDSSYYQLARCTSITNGACGLGYERISTPFGSAGPDTTEAYANTQVFASLSVPGPQSGLLLMMGLGALLVRRRSA